MKINILLILTTIIAVVSLWRRESLIIPLLAFVIFIVLFSKFKLKVKLNSKQRKYLWIILVLPTVLIMWIFYQYVSFVQLKKLSTISHELEVCHNWQKNINNLRHLCSVYDSNAQYKFADVGTVYGNKKNECDTQLAEMKEKFKEYSQSGVLTGLVYYEANDENQNTSNTGRQQDISRYPADLALRNSLKNILPMSDEFISRSLDKILPDKDRKTEKELYRLIDKCYKENVR